MIAELIILKPRRDTPPMRQDNVHPLKSQQASTNSLVDDRKLIEEAIHAELEVIRISAPSSAVRVDWSIYRHSPKC